MATATSLCDRLVEGGAEHLHFYTLNKPELTRDVCMALGLSRPAAARRGRLRADAGTRGGRRRSPRPAPSRPPRASARGAALTWCWPG